MKENTIIGLYLKLVFIILLNITFDTQGYCKTPQKNDYIDKLNIKASYGHYDKVEYTTIEKKITTDIIINNVGEFIITYFTRNGKTMAWPSRYIEAPFQSYLDENGEIKEPIEKFEGTNIEGGYGLKFNFLNSEITFAAGCRHYDGLTPNKTFGTNSKDFNLLAFKIYTVIENSAFKLKFNYLNKNGEYQSGNEIYTSTRNGILDEYNLDFTLPIAGHFESFTSICFEKDKQNLNFDFRSYPQLIPNTIATGNKYSLKQGVIFKQAIQMGIITNFGNTLVSLLDADIKPGFPSSGIYIDYTQNNIKLSLIFDQIKADKTGSYFTDSDLFQYIKKNEVLLNLTYNNFSTTIKWGNINKKSQFLKVTPLDMFLVNFPSTDRICIWDENIVAIYAEYQFTKFNVGINFTKSIGTYNQYGLENEINQQDLLTFFIEYKF